MKEGKVIYKVVSNEKFVEQGQKSEIDYINDLVNENIQWVTFELVFKDGKSHFEREDKVYPEHIKINNSMIDGLVSGGKYFYDSSTKILLNEKFVLGKNYLISSNSEDVLWKVTNEQKEINGYKCYKATKIEEVINSKGVFKHTITAWFTPSLPFQFGPKNNNSLPGLILVLEDKNYTYYVEKLIFNEIVNLPELKGKSITYNDFMKEISLK
jgi:GLPGLI family protein